MTEDGQDNDPWWATLLYMVLFYFIFTLAGYMLIGLAVAQWFVRVLSGAPQPELVRFGGQFGEYMKQIVQYISMQSEDKPYPFQPWPSVDASKQGS